MVMPSTESVIELLNFQQAVGAGMPAGYVGYWAPAPLLYKAVLCAAENRVEVQTVNSSHEQMLGKVTYPP